MLAGKPFLHLREVMQDAHIVGAAASPDVLDGIVVPGVIKTPLASGNLQLSTQNGPLQYERRATPKVWARVCGTRRSIRRDSVERYLVQGDPTVRLEVLCFDILGFEVPGAGVE